MRAIVTDIKSRIVLCVNKIGSQYWLDILIIFGLAIAGSIATYKGTQLINPNLLIPRYGGAWFDGDVAQVMTRMIDPLSDQRRTTVHPLFPLVAVPLVKVLNRILGNLQAAVNTAMAITAAFWLSTLFLVMRLMGCRKLDAALFTLLGAVSATAIFWFVVPETHTFSSVATLLAFCLFGLAQYFSLSPLWYTIISALTLSMSVTNWVIGWILTKMGHTWAQFCRISSNALVIVTVLWGIQRTFVPITDYFLAASEERGRILSSLWTGFTPALRSFLIHTLVMPQFTAIPGDLPEWSWMITQQSLPGSGSIWGAIAVGLWVALLGLGIWGLFQARTFSKFRLAIGLSVLSQLAIFLLYGWETFLYAPKFAPLLILLAALSTLTKQRTIALLLVLLLIPTAGVNNLIMFQRAIDFYATHGNERHLVQTQIRTRANDPWMRGVGHVLMALPGSLEADKSYHEPGGSFSPAVGSFGVSIWVMDQTGTLKATSDTIPLEQIQQQWAEAAKSTVPKLLTRTPYYRATWSVLDQSSWQLTLEPTQTEVKLVPVIRSVGPAGAPIQALQWNGQQIQVNRRWSITPPSSTQVFLGSELDRQWQVEKLSQQQWQGRDGWGYARLELPDAKRWTITLQDSTQKPPLSLPTTTLTSNLSLDLPDAKFVDSLNAQVAHIGMGVVGQETRPADPTTYPIAAHQQAAYQVVALVRAGKLELAKVLSRQLANQDFSGSEGAEADAPGLAIWALAETANALRDRDYERQIWAAVRRKAQIIEAMLSTTEPIYKPSMSEIAPDLLEVRIVGIEPSYFRLSTIAQPAKDGLIVGRIKAEFPMPYVNAISYRGLMDAAMLAERGKHNEDADRWRTQAKQLQQNWEKAFPTASKQYNPTYLSRSWQSWISTNLSQVLQSELQKRWQQTRDRQGLFKGVPEQADLEIAEAHQWLYLAQPNQAWKILQWFWQNQSSPGLYTWWETHPQLDRYHRWENVRGWISPPHITPHYGAAAEMLLLQLDMLAYAEPSERQPQLVIGAGIPAEWLKSRMQVKGIVTGGREISWRWDGQQMQVQITGEKAAVKLGANFPPNTPLQVSYVDRSVLKT